MRDLAVQRAVVASWAPEAVETVSRAELERRAGRALSEGDVERLAAMSIVERGGEVFRVDPGLLRLGVELLDVPLSPETLLAARTALIEHSARRRTSCRGCCATRSRSGTRGMCGRCPRGCIRWWCRRC
ncbi:hypothetical protein SHKM778_37890 [Streptomyces sp. KM77-8]|uniref:Uncharacterized protein n=1 Tax=Streptomyces haneummycinicus TaxID=3074435 RepID=A0AAT9HJ52_9ACTN